jgi:subfamily B ATP-binding cassette protein MsbA
LKDSLRTYSRLLRYARPYARGFWLALAGMIVAAATEPLFPALMKPLLDQGFVARENFAPWVVPAAIIGIFLLRGIATFSSSYAFAWVGNHVLVDIRKEMFARLMRLPAARVEHEATTMMVNRIVFEVVYLSEAITRVLTAVIRDSLVIVGLLAWLLILNWRLTLVALVLIPLMAAIVAVFSRRIRRLNQENFNNYGEMSRMVEEAANGHKVIKIYDAYEPEQRAFAQAVERVRSFAMRLTVAGSATVPVTQLAAAIAVAIVVSIALIQSMNNQTTVGGFVSFVTAMLMLLAPLKHLADLNTTFQRGLTAAEIVFKLLDELPEADRGTRRIERARGELAFEQLRFRYPDAERDALAGVDLQVRAGEVVALVGGSGGGKTTLLNLIPRFFSPTGGRVLLDGVPIEELTLASLRAQIAMVSQDVVLFNDTVRENVAFGLGERVSDEQVWRALEHASLGDFVRSLPGGLSAAIGERGAKFSGGQRQRLAIARALLKDAPILLLDEATSALDSETEREVQQALERTMQGRTTLIIAHRLSTIERADRIVVVEQGRIVEQGRHAQLLAADGVYSRLYRIQYAAAATAG